MTQTRPAVQRASLALIGLLVVAAVAAGYLAVSTSRHQEEETLPTSAVDRSAIPSLATVRSNVSQQGLQLVATIRPTDVLQGQQNVTVNAQVYDTVKFAARVNTTSMTNPAHGPCQQGVATGMRLYAGVHDRTADLSQANELLLYDPSKIYTCPQVSQFQYIFDPYSNTITVNGKGAGHLNETSVISGYFVPGPGASYTFLRLPLGYYTIEVFDAWGQEALAPVRVVASLPATSGLELRLSDNASAMRVGQSLHVDISLFNDLPIDYPVPASRDWPFEGAEVALWPACYGDPSAYVVVLKGNYSIHELMRVANITNIPFPCMEGASVDLVTFQANSSLAILHGSGFGPDPGPYRLSANFTTSGYWDLSTANSSLFSVPIVGESPPRLPPTTAFVPGIYTVAVADEWGQFGVLHFRVAGGG